MSKIKCHLRLSEVPLHLNQIIAGFQLLQKQGIISLEIEKLSKQNPDKLPYNMMEVILNDTYHILYDVNDGYDNLLKPGEDYYSFMDDLLDRFDSCFKRSFSESYNAAINQKDKIHPLGLNYMVTVKGNKAHLPAPNDPRKEKIKKLIRMLPFSEFYNGLYKIEAFEEPPTKPIHSKILFMARLWDVAGDYEGQISKEKADERAWINENRANCIRLCRKEFGNQFFGAVTPSAFANKYYSDIVIDNASVTKRYHYLQKMKESSICIATTGLHQSIGWKFAEYVASSKAIVTEPLHYEVPGDFRENKNYVVFKTPEDCVNQINRLLNNPDAQYDMMVHNFDYYHHYMRPDRLILNTILQVFHGGMVHMNKLKEVVI